MNQIAKETREALICWSLLVLAIAVGGIGCVLALTVSAWLGLPLFAVGAVLGVYAGNRLGR